MAEKDYTLPPGETRVAVRKPLARSPQPPASPTAARGVARAGVEEFRYARRSKTETGVRFYDLGVRLDAEATATAGEARWREIDLTENLLTINVRDYDDIYTLHPIIPVMPPGYVARYNARLLEGFAERVSIGVREYPACRPVPHDAAPYHFAEIVRWRSGGEDVFAVSGENASPEWADEGEGGLLRLGKRDSSRLEFRGGLLHNPAALNAHPATRTPEYVPDVTPTFSIPLRGLVRVYLTPRIMHRWSTITHDFPTDKGYPPGWTILGRLSVLPDPPALVAAFDSDAAQSVYFVAPGGATGGSAWAAMSALPLGLFIEPLPTSEPYFTTHTPPLLACVVTVDGGEPYYVWDTYRSADTSGLSRPYEATAIDL